MFADHDAYIAAAPEDLRPLLVRLRAQLAITLPDAEEIIAYKIPGFMGYLHARWRRQMGCERNRTENRLSQREVGSLHLASPQRQTCRQEFPRRTNDSGESCQTVNPETPSKTDAGNGSYGICRVIAARRSPDPGRSTKKMRRLSITAVAGMLGGVLSAEAQTSPPDAWEMAFRDERQEVWDRLRKDDGKVTADEVIAENYKLGSHYDGDRQFATAFSRGGRPTT